MVTEPTYYAFRRWLDTPIIWQDDWIPRDLGVSSWGTKLDLVYRLPKKPRWLGETSRSKQLFVFILPGVSLKKNGWHKTHYYLEGHLSKWLIIMVLVSPLSRATFPFQMAQLHGGYKWGWSDHYLTTWDDPPSTFPARCHLQLLLLMFRGTLERAQKGRDMMLKVLHAKSWRKKRTFEPWSKNPALLPFCWLFNGDPYNSR